MVAAFRSDLSAYDWLYPQLLGLLVKPYGACQTVMVGQGEGGHIQCPSFLQEPVQRGGPIEEAILRMDMEVNEAHCADLIEDSGEEPVFPESVKLIGAIAGIGCVYAKEKAHFLFLPPLGWLFPGIEDLLDSIEAFSPDKGCYRGGLVLVDFNGFADEP